MPQRDTFAASSTPSHVVVWHDSPTASLADSMAAAQAGGGRWTTEHLELHLSSVGHITVQCPRQPLARIAIRWDADFADETLFLGDHWERGYGDLQWRTCQPERIMPWHFAAHAHGRTMVAGVKTQPAAMCFWTADRAGVTLWLDFRNGGLPSIPGDRIIAAASVVVLHGDDPQTTLTAACRAMCPSPRLAPKPVCGNNNWYYAYGHNFDHDQVLRDAALLAELSAGHPNRPYCVIDAGWSPGGSCPGGPWTHGWPGKFPDMPGLASQISAMGVVPGIWMRPTALTTVTHPHLLRPGPQPGAEKGLDLSLPETLGLIHDDVARVCGWGYRLIKHDFSTYDAFARWGFEMGAEITDGGWHFADRTCTNAELILELYKTLRRAAGDAILIGCNTIGHLGAGLFEVQRTGDDTSGRVWERTRRMGVNTLAFRMAQHNTFFAADADCVAHTPQTPWPLDRQWLDLVARSGTALFVSADPRTVTAEVTAAMKAAMHLALSGGHKDVRVLDWMATTCPERWQFDGEIVRYDFGEKIGANPTKC